MAVIFSNVVQNTNLQIRKLRKSQRKINIKKTPPGHIIVTKRKFCA